MLDPPWWCLRCLACRALTRSPTRVDACPRPMQGAEPVGRARSVRAPNVEPRGVLMV